MSVHDPPLSFTIWLFNFGVKERADQLVLENASPVVDQFASFFLFTVSMGSSLPSGLIRHLESIF